MGTPFVRAQLIYSTQLSFQLQQRLSHTHTHTYIIQLNNLHHTLHPTITKTLIESFHITHSYCSSPLTCPTQLTKYSSLHNRDKILGSMRTAQSFKWQGTCIAYPTDHHTTVEAIHWTIVAAKEDINTTTIHIINHNDWTSQQISLTTNADTHTLATNPPPPHPTM